MKKLTRIFIMIITLVIIVLSIISIFRNKRIKMEDGDYINGLPVHRTYSLYLYDTSTPEKAYGASKYVFMAKVNKILRTEYKDDNPITVYSVSVIKNIKGNLITDKDIEFKQSGGISKKEKYYVFEHDSEYLYTDGYYLFLAGVDENNDFLINNPERMIYLGKDLELIKGVEDKTITYNNIDPHYRDLATNIEKYLFIDEELPPERNNDSFITFLDGISKYDIDYNK